MYIHIQIFEFHTFSLFCTQVSYVHTYLNIYIYICLYIHQMIHIIVRKKKKKIEKKMTLHLIIEQRRNNAASGNLKDPLVLGDGKNAVQCLLDWNFWS